jgi:branched-chain amino acid transport system ATP-binding protein
MEGRVVLDGKDLTRRPAHRIARAGIAYVPAERHLFPAMTLRTNLVLGAYPSRPDPEMLELVYDLFPRLKDRQRQQAGTISGGDGLKKKGMTLLIAEQQVPLALSVADRGYVLENGRIRLEGAADELAQNPEVRQAYLGVA